MRLRLLLLAAVFIAPTPAHADTFTTTITGSGNTLVFPNVGGPSNYTYYTRINQIYAAPLYVYVNGGSITQGALIFNLSSGSSYQDLSFSVPASSGQPAVGAALYGPNVITFVDGEGFYAPPGTYNLTDKSGTPFTYTVTDVPNVPPPPAPEIDPSLAVAGLTLLTGGIVVLRGRRAL